MTKNISKYRFDYSGNWSGGGQAFLNNARHAESRHPILSGDRSSTTLVPRNYPGLTHLRSGDYVLIPQNAWPWNLKCETPEEARIALGLRIASTLAMKRAHGIVRISTTIPTGPAGKPSSPIIHNVLDSGFEEALAEVKNTSIASALDKFVCVGSTFSYKNMDRLARAYKLYRDGGGTVGLYWAGAESNQKVARRIQSTLGGLSDVSIVGSTISRIEALAAMRDAHAVILPSLVEASPLTALEATFANPNVILSDIPGHREVFGFDHPAPNGAYFTPTSDGDLARRLWEAGNTPLTAAHASLNSYEYRESERVRWGNQIVEWLGKLNACHS
ncbi:MULTISPECIES: glycosyltransferase [unclassified Dietzia]|uniref:glycosyltransferase n=1 Tax=unclassified Dietzia TaxID=2617939 RepID=UPI000D210D52|nr:MULTISPECIES: glycosyltransferase [unclassified Dietzia]AVZ40297.1 hypothetical protein CT688_13285 [Dietzia sp. JS16-p6b]